MLLASMAIKFFLQKYLPLDAVKRGVYNFIHPCHATGTLPIVGLGSKNSSSRANLIFRPAM